MPWQSRRRSSRCHHLGRLPGHDALDLERPRLQGFRRNPAEAVFTATMKRIALTLARSKDFPNGSSQIGYDFIAPLDSNGHIDLPAWKKHRRRIQRPAFFCWCTRRAAPSMGGGCLTTMSRVTTTTRLAFCSDTMPGEYVSIRDAKGTMHTFMVKSVISVSP